MDRKSLIILAVAVLALMVMSPVVDFFFPPPPHPIRSAVVATNQIASTNQPGSANLETPAAGKSLPATQSEPVVAAPATPSAPEKILSITNDDAIFFFTSHGGGLKTIRLRNYPSVVSRAREGVGETNMAAFNTDAPEPILAMPGTGAAGGDDYELSQPNATTIRADKTFTNGLHLAKEFDLANTGTNFLFVAKIRIENTGAEAVRVPEHQVVLGTSTPIGPLDDPTTLGTIWYNGAKAVDINAAWFANRTLGCFPGTPRSEFADGVSNVVWAAPHNQFFALAVIPSKPAPSLSIHQVWLPMPDTNGLNAPNAKMLTNGFLSAFVYPAQIIQPGRAVDESYTFYAGPKQYNYLAKIGARMGNNLDLVMGFSGFLGFGFFSKLLLLCMNGLHAIGLGYGFAIIGITVIIKLIFWPLSAAGTRSQKRLQALQPQLKAIADKYKDDAMKKHEKTQEFMKANNINPMGSCLPMLIQIPVFFGFYSMLRNAIELRGVPFLWAHDLSQCDTIAVIGGFPINPLPLIMGATQLWQSHLTPPSPGMDPGQQKMMRYMPVFLIALFYKMSAGLIVYWTISNLLTIAQTVTTRASMDAPVTTGVPAPAKKKK